MKYNYFVVDMEFSPEEVECDNKQKQDHYCFAYVDRVAECINLKSHFADKRIVSFNLFEGGKKKAEQIAADWNEAYKKNGTFAF